MASLSQANNISLICLFPYFHFLYNLFWFLIQISETVYNRGLRLNSLFGELVMRICEEPDILFRELKEWCCLMELICSVTDEFTVNLIRIAKKAIDSPYYQHRVMGLMRSDYMLEKNKKTNESQLFQIELNTISCSFSGEEEQLTKLHQYVLSSHCSDMDAISKFMNVSVMDIERYINDTEFNKTIEGTCDGLYEGVMMYNRT